jgi:uncharacterized membrane protein YqjE
MSEHRGRPGGGESSSVVELFKRTLAVLSSILHTRLELFVTELEEQRERLKQALILTLLAFFGLSLGFILLTIFLVVLFWERGWLVALGGLAALYLGVGIAAALMLRRKIVARTGLFSASLEELAKDRDHLRGSYHE